MRAELRPARLIWEGGGSALRQVGRALEANFGVPRLSPPLGPGSSAMGITSGATSALRSPLSSRTYWARLSLTVLQRSRGSGSGSGGSSAPEANSRRRGQPGLERPLSGTARLQITTWLAAGAPAPARHRPLQLAAKFMPVALQWRPRSARSIPTTRLRAVRPEGGVSGV